MFDHLNVQNDRMKDLIKTTYIPHDDDTESLNTVKSLTFDVVFRRGERVLARGSMKTVCCRLRPGHELESLEIPALYLERIQEHREVDAG